VNLANKKYSKVQNDFEITLEAKTEIEECEEASSLPTIKYNFVTLQELHNLPKDSNLDIIGILKEYGDVSEITSQKTNRTMQKRDLTLVDESGFFVRLTLWGKEAKNFSSDKENPVVAFKGVKVFAYEGRSLGMTSSSIMTRDPDIPESYALQGWYDSTGSTMTFQSQRNAGGSLPGSGGGGFNRSEMKTLCEMKLEADRIPDSDEKPVYFSTRAMVMHIRNENIAYPACETCKKKVVEEGGSWRCDKCNKLWSRPTYRYIMSFVVSDHSGQAWFQGFNDVGDTLFGKSANEITEIKVG
ncbi:putative replication factor A protein 1, partial [Lentinula raphanica]